MVPILSLSKKSNYLHFHQLSHHSSIYRHKYISVSLIIFKNVSSCVLSNMNTSGILTLLCIPHLKLPQFRNFPIYLSMKKLTIPTSAAGPVMSEMPTPTLIPLVFSKNTTRRKRYQPLILKVSRFLDVNFLSLLFAKKLF